MSRLARIKYSKTGNNWVTCQCISASRLHRTWHDMQCAIIAPLSEIHLAARTFPTKFNFRSSSRTFKEWGIMNEHKISIQRWQKCSMRSTTNEQKINADRNFRRTAKRNNVISVIFLSCGLKYSENWIGHFFISTISLRDSSWNRSLF